LTPCSTVMELFQGFCQDFDELVEEIRKKLSDIAIMSTPDERKRALSSLEKTFKDAEETLSSLSLSARQTGQAEECQETVKKYGQELKQLRKDSEQAAFQSDRMSLLGGTDEQAATAIEQRKQFMSLTERQEHQTSSLERSSREAEELVELGTNILSDLEIDREKIQRSKNKLGSVNASLDSAGQKIKEMWTRMIGNKIIRIIIIIVLLVIIGLIIFLKFFYGYFTGNKGGPTTAPPINGTLFF